MQKIISVLILLAIIATLQAKAFAAPLNCEFKDTEVQVEGIQTIQMSDEALIINETEFIALEHTRIKCGVFGKQNRFDGTGKGLQIILKSCTDKAVLEGHLIDSTNSKVAAVICGEKQR